MTTANRVQRWREAKRQNGLKALTIWLSEAEELRLKDLALQWYCSPSALVQQALAQFHPGPAQNSGNVIDTIQLRQLIREELAAMQVTQTPVTGNVTVSVTDMPVEDTTTAETATTEHVTARGNGNVTDMQMLPEATAPAVDEEQDGTVPAPAAGRARRGIPKLTPRQVRALRDKRQRGVSVPALMDEYGISRASVFRYLQSEKR